MKKRKKMLYYFLILLILLILGGVLVLQLPQFGKLPSGKRLERLKNSPNYRNGYFQNLSYTPLLSPEKNQLEAFWRFFFGKKHPALLPSKEIPTQKTNLSSFNPNDNVLVWLGHSSYFMQIEGQTFLIDPVLVSASPFSFGVEMFKGAGIYQPKDLPLVDYLIITHDHYDHLDYETIKTLKGKVKNKIIVPLGVGEHLEYWGFSSEMISEMDWNEEISLEKGAKLFCLPSRHSSGRGLLHKKTLWASFMLQTSAKTIYLGGDSSYDVFFKEIGQRFPQIDLAVMENGQYNEDWRYNHFLPEALVLAVKDLNPKRVLAFHNSKFALARHPWYEPLQKVVENAQKEGFNLSTPMIGQVVDLEKPDEKFEKWWEPLIKMP